MLPSAKFHPLTSLKYDFQIRQEAHFRNDMAPQAVLRVAGTGAVRVRRAEVELGRVLDHEGCGKVGVSRIQVDWIDGTHDGTKRRIAPEREVDIHPGRQRPIELAERGRLIESGKAVGQRERER